MWEIILATLLVLFLAGVFLYSLRRRPAVDWPARIAAEGEPAVVAGLQSRVDMLGALGSLFHDDDYRWLLERGLREAARTLKRRRVRLARRYLRELRDTFEQLLSLYSFLAAGQNPAPAERDQAAAMALRFRLKWAGAYCLLPLNYARLNLAGLAEIRPGMMAALEMVTRPAPLTAP